MLNAHFFPTSQILFDEKNIQVDARHHRHPLLASFLEKPFLLVHSVQRTWEAGRSRTPTFSIRFSLLLWIVFQSTCISSRALTFFCPLNAISTVSYHFFLDLPSVAAATEVVTVEADGIKKKKKNYCRVSSSVCFFIETTRPL